MGAQSKTNIWIDGSQAGSTLKELKKSVNLLNREIADLPRNSDAYKKKMMELKDANGALTNHKNQIKGVAQSYGTARQGIGGMISQFAPMVGAIGIATTVIGGVTSAIGSWYANNKEMEKSLSSLKALTGASTEDIKFYKEAAKEMGKTTTVSAMEAVEGFKLIGSARPELLKNKEALAGVTREVITFSEAAEMDMATSAQAVAGAMNQFNLAADQSSRIINAYAAGSKEGAAEVNDLSQSIDKFGTVASSNNITLEESVALTELLSEKNIKGSEAGTQLRNVLLNISTASALPDEALKAMEQYGVNLDIVQNKALPLEERLREMSKVQADQNALVKIFGKENVVAGATVLKNVDHLSTLTQAVTGTNTAYEQAATNTDNLDGDLKRLGSAWEGLTLSMDGGGSIFRPIVQAGTDMLNWVSDTVVAFKEWDTTKMETQLMKLANAIPIVSAVFGDMLEESIRVNELTSQVTDAYRKEGDQVAVLTSALVQNNEALKTGKMTEIEATKAKEENEKIISALNEKYPELTENIDLHKISASEMNVLQKELNKTILDQAIQTAKAAEQERIIQSIIENTIALQRRKNEEANSGWFENSFKVLMGESSIDAAKELEKETKHMKELDKTFQGVEKTVNGLNLDFGADFKANGQLAQNAMKDLDKLVKKYEQTHDKALKKSLEAQIKGLKQTIKIGNDNQQKQLDGILGSFEGIKEQEAQAADAAEKAAERKKEANKKAADAYKKLRDELDNLIKATEKLLDESAYKKKLDAFTDEQQKELFVLEKNINEKYEKEIQTATDLSKKKGEIGIKAQEQLNTLIALRDQELVDERLKINDKFAKEKAAQEYDQFKTGNLEAIKQYEAQEKALMDLKVARAVSASKAVADADIETRKAADEELRKILVEQLEFEKTRKIEALLDEYDRGDINQQTLNAKKQQLEIEHRDAIEQINSESEQKLLQESMDRLSGTLDTISGVLDTISQVYDAAYDKRINQIDESKNKEIQALEEQYQKGIISKDKLEQQKAVIEGKADEQRKAIENEKAKKDKEFAIAQAVIAAALAVLKAAPNPIMMAVAAGIGIAQIGIISGQEVPQYAEGGYHNVVGAKDGLMYRAKNIGRHKGGMLPDEPSLLLASEAGPEYFVPYNLLSDQRVANHVGAIEAIRTNQFASGGYTSGSGPVGGANGDQQLIAVLQANLGMMAALGTKIDNMQVVIGEKHIEDMNKKSAEMQNLRN